MLDIVILAIVQGIAEFLPISSSGHLVILGTAMGEFRQSPTLVIILHAGTLGSILVIYWRKIIDLLLSDKRVIGLLFVGTLPAAVVGLTIKSQFQWVLGEPLLTGAMFLVTGCMLIALGRLKPQQGLYQQLNLGNAFLIGCFQAFAIFPGVSRSGSTILGGRLLGLKNEDSITFSFLLAIPAILGAAVLEIKDLAYPVESSDGLHPPIDELAVGAIIAFVVGIVALKWLIGWSRLDRLHWFAWWCIPLGIAVIAASMAVSG